MNSTVRQFWTELRGLGRPWSLYLDWFDGLRAFYEQKEGVGCDPGLSAATTLAGLASMNVIDFLLSIDAFVGAHHYTPSGHLISKTLVAALAAITIIGHIKAAESLIHFKRPGPPRTNMWASTFRLYCAATLGWWVALMGWALYVASHS